MQTVNPRSVEARGIIGLADAYLNNRNHDERATILQLLTLSMCGGLQGLLKCPDVVSRHWEYLIGTSRADMVLFHIDNSVSIIEAKGPKKTAVEAASGIGQLLVYGATLPTAIGYVPTRLNLILAFPRLGNKDDEYALDVACNTAGVVPLRLASPEQVFQFADDEMAEIVTRG